MKTIQGLRAFICGCQGERLRPSEHVFFRDARPCGLILFKRNCRSPEQVRALVDSFRDAVGMSPIRYLTAWRMELAADRMLTTDDALAQIADRVGYDSEASFNRAFKRTMGVPPGAWRRARAPASGATRWPGAPSNASHPTRPGARSSARTW
jgi:AraC-like DNA-binding protein